MENVRIMTSEYVAKGYPNRKAYLEALARIAGLPLPKSLPSQLSLVLLKTSLGLSPTANNASTRSSKRSYTSLVLTTTHLNWSTENRST